MSDRVMGTILCTIAIVLAAYKLWKLFRKLYCDIKFKSEKTGDAVSAEQYMDELTKQDEHGKPEEEQQASKDQPEQRKQPQDGDSGEQGGSQGGESDPKGTPKEEGGQKEQPETENVGGKESPKEGGSGGQPGSDGTPQDASQGQEDPQHDQEGQDGNPAGQGSGSQEQGGSGGADGPEVEQAIKEALQAAVEDGTLTRASAEYIQRTMELDNLLKEYSKREGEARSKKDQPQRPDAPGAEEDKKPKSDEELLQQALVTCGMTEDDIKDYTGSAQGRDDPKETYFSVTKEKLAAKPDKSLFDIMLLKAFSLDAIDTLMVAIKGEALTLRELIVYVALCKSCHGEAELYMSRKLSYYIQMCDGYGIPRLYDYLAEKLQGLFPKDHRLQMIKEPGRLHDLVNGNDIL